MKHDRALPQFYMTSPSPCPYLEGREERKVFTHLVGQNAEDLNDALTQCGFRRSQNIAYRPACDDCDACVSVRVVVDEFEPGRTNRRTWRRNGDLAAGMRRATPSSEQYSLFRSYLDARHAHGGMADMTMLDYVMMVEESAIDTNIVEYRVREPGWLETRTQKSGRLVASALTDVLRDGLSMVYSFYDPEETARSLGTYMILDHIRRAKRMGLPYLYLGYWVRGSDKMDYKSKFAPQEHLGLQGWERITG